MENTPKTKNEILKEMQIIAEDVEKYKLEIEKMLNLIDDLEIKYYELADKIKQN